jgi:hypothetical protein
MKSAAGALVNDDERIEREQESKTVVAARCSAP